MNLQLIFWIGLISSVCCVFGQAGKNKVAYLSVQYLVSLFDHLESWENLSPAVLLLLLRKALPRPRLSQSQGGAPSRACQALWQVPHPPPRVTTGIECTTERSLGGIIECVSEHRKQRRMTSLEGNKVNV